MIVVDASAITELLLQTSLGSHVEARLFRDGDDFHAPHLLDVEVVQALRRLVILNSDRGVAAVSAGSYQRKGTLFHQQVVKR